MKYTFTSDSTFEDDDSNNKMTLSEIQAEKQRLEIEEMISIERGLESDNAMELIKASQAYSSKMQSSSKPQEGKSYFMDPLKGRVNSGWLDKDTHISPDLLRRMAQTPIFAAIIGTRVSQGSDFSSPQSIKNDTGFRIQRKKGFYNNISSSQLDKKDKIEANRITNFLLNCGDDSNTWNGDNFDDFLKKIIYDSLVLDSATFEVVENKKGEPSRFFAVDGGTIAKADSKGSKAKPINNQLPNHVQIMNNNIVAEYYPWELCFGIRNCSTDVNRNGYGRSELEDLINIVTWSLNADTMNGLFFEQGSSPRGILKVASGVNRNRLQQFRNEWASMVTGLKGAWKIPVIEGDKMDWIDFQRNNTDMQFSAWQEYLIKIGCAVFKMTPEEVNFAQGSGGRSDNPFDSGGAQHKFRYSKDKGLKPLLTSISAWINKWIVNRLNPEFEFVFTGLEVDDEAAELKMDIEKVSSFMGFKEMRRKYNLPEEFEEGDMPLNPHYIQNKQFEEFGSVQAEGNTKAVEDLGSEKESTSNNSKQNNRREAVQKEKRIESLADKSLYESDLMEFLNKEGEN